MNFVENLSSNIMIGLVGSVVAVVLVLVLLALRQPVLAKLGVRNIPRRPLQSSLIVIGLTLSTIIVISALAIGNTLDYSLRRHAINAYGAIDEIIAPPLLSTLAQLAGAGAPETTQTTGADGDQAANFDTEESAGAAGEALLNADALTTILNLLEEGLPGIDYSRYEQLRERVSQEPLIDGVAPSIIFPTIIRDSSSGQGEPLGFVVAVDDEYTEKFGLHSADGAEVRMDRLRPGVGNIFTWASRFFGLINQTSNQLGFGDIRVSDVATAIAGAGAAITSVAGDGSLLQQSGILSATGGLTQTLTSLGVSTDTLAALGVGGGNADLAGLLTTLNLNTLSSEIDRTLGQAGLQLREGEVYLSRLGAEQLNARPGDRLEIFLGPIPLPYRVVDVVDEAGPLAALTPVVLMRLDEAQQLLFMQNRINNVLVSNQGDDLKGLQHTAAVSQRLRVLALNDDLVTQIAAVLRQPAVRKVLDAAVAKEQAASPFGPGEQPPAWLADMLTSILPLTAVAEKVGKLPVELDKPGVSDELRTLFAEQEVRTFLRDLDVPAAERTNWQGLLDKVNEMDVLDPLTKQAVVTLSNVVGTAFSSIFTVFGMFSIVAGVMLIFLIFVMLAAERRSEMGLARAIGVQRGHLVQMFVTEGVLYDLVAAALGLALGLAVSYTMVGFIGGLFNQISGRFTGRPSTLFEFHFNVTTVSLIIAYCLGVLFTFVVVTISSWRVSLLNIATAIRDLPDEAAMPTRSLLGKVWRWLAGLFWIVVAGLLYWYYGQGNQTIVLAAVTLALLGVATVAARLLEATRLRLDQIDRLRYTVVGLGVLVLWVTPWNSLFGQSGLSALMQEGPTYLLSFVLGPILIIFGAILVVMYNADVITWLVTRALGGVSWLTPVLRTAIAYPLSTRFRTGMAMVMFAMIVCTVSVMAVVIEATQALIVLDAKESGGFEISTSNTLLSFFDPIRNLQDEIALQRDAYPLLQQITAVGGVATTDAQAREAGRADWLQLELTGVDAGYVAQAATVYSFKARAPGFADDAAVWAALATRDDVAIMTPDLLERSARRQMRMGDPDAPNGSMSEMGFSPPFAFSSVVITDSVLPALTIELQGAISTTRTVQVIGLLQENTTRAGGDFQVNLATLSALAGEESPATTYYLKTTAGADVRGVAQEVERAFLSSGIDASVMAEGFAQGQAVTRGILRLLQGFMALGLLVGIAALGVITSRSVVERRQQVGMLRALGYQRNMVALSFVLEASFIAITGILIGAATGILLGENMVRAFFTDLTPQTQVGVPWLQLGVILAIAYGFSLLMALIPALQAARIYPAEALRYE